eukprot:CAMPEP_0185009328 /NCGR_PEP_ID=MMETSP1098-20130426/91865_1 /TAXON_ID=89044 /ORGANISM="Spumella elongata, Strain CCAP 955/1" /LENGTH=742 /DNA_ID=CAMNT_0027537989 /DNA_START=24 /DNA_END=2248 /DNA_ORIENTATION=-
MSYGLVDPMEVFASMTASLLEKQPVPFNPMYAIKPTPAPKLKVGGKPPREVFYRDTLTFMTKLPPPVQPKVCTCQYLCTGAPAAIICHSCSIYDPSRSAFYCDRCFPARHPWHRAPHLYTTIENDESIEHTFKIAHRVAEAKRYENEGKGILKRLRQEIPKLKYVADDEKVDDDIRLYGRRMVAVEEKLLEMRASLQEDILHGDEHRRANLYSRENTTDSQPETILALEDSTTNLRKQISATNTPSASNKPLKLAELRNLPFFESEPLFTDLVEGNDNTPTLPLVPRFPYETEPSVQAVVLPPVYNEPYVDTPPADPNNVPESPLIATPPETQDSSQPNSPVSPPKRSIRVSFIRADSAESAGSLTVSPMNDNNNRGSFFKENDDAELRRELNSGLPSIAEINQESLFNNEVVSDDIKSENIERSELLAITENENHGFEVPTTTTLAVHIDDATDAHIIKPHNYEETSPGLKKVLSGISFTSVAHTDIDSVHSGHSNHSSGNELDLPGPTDRYSNWSVYKSDLSTLSSSSMNIQRMFKGYLSRRTVSKMLTSRLVRVFSPEIGRDYYYDKITGASMWEPPKLLQSDHLDELQYVAEAAPTKVWACKRDCPRRKKDPITRKIFAKIVLTAFARCILARYRIKRRADEVYRRVWDADSSTYYYANVVTGTTSWVKTAVYLHPSGEPPVYNDSGANDSIAKEIGSMKGQSAKRNVGISGKFENRMKGSEKTGRSSKRISPRANRV